MRRFACLGGLVVCGAVLWASRAAAQGALPLELEWHAPAECPGADAVHEELARIARAREGSVLQHLRARAELRRAAGGYTLTLHTEHAGLQGTRQLTAADCPTLVRSATLVLALAFGAGVELSEPTPPPGAAVLPATTPLPAPAPARAHEHESALPATLAADSGEPTHPTWRLWLGAGAQFALLPTTAFSSSLGAELQLAHWSLGLRALILPGVSSDTTLEGLAITSHFAALGAAVRGCGLLPLGPVVLGACASLQLAAIRGRSEDTSALQSSSATAPWYSLAAGLSLDWPRTAALRLRLEADLALSLNRPEFGIEDLGSVYHVPRWAPLLAAGVVISP